MNNIIKYFAIAMVCFIAGAAPISSDASATIGEKYSPKQPLEKVTKSLSVVERKVRNAAVKVVTGGGHGSGTVVQYKDLTLVLTAKHVDSNGLLLKYL